MYQDDAIHLSKFHTLLFYRGLVAYPASASVAQCIKVSIHRVRNVNAKCLYIR